MRHHREIAIWGAGKTGRRFLQALRFEGFTVKLWIDVNPRLHHRPLHGAEVVPVASLERARDLPLIVAVGAEGARELIRAELTRRHFVELRDYWVVA